MFFLPSFQDHLHFFSPQRLSITVTPVPLSREKPGRVWQAAWERAGMLRWRPGPPLGLKPKSLAQQRVPVPRGAAPGAAGPALSSATSISYPVLFVTLSRHFSAFLFGTSFVYTRDSKSHCSFKLLYYYNLLLQISFKKLVCIIARKLKSRDERSQLF